MAEEHERCPNLFQVLGAYLHQDFDLDYSSADEALNASLRENSEERLDGALAELRKHRPAVDDEASTRHFVNELCDYHPPGDGLTYVEWLDCVDAALTAAASA